MFLNGNGDALAYWNRRIRADLQRLAVGNDGEQIAS
jgi:hypothetical protein